MVKRTGAPLRQDPNDVFVPFFLVGDLSPRLVKDTGSEDEESL